MSIADAPFFKLFVFKENAKLDKKTLGIFSYILYPLFIWIVKQRDRGQFFMFSLNQQNKRPFNINFLDSWKKNDEQRFELCSFFSSIQYVICVSEFEND